MYTNVCVFMHYMHTGCVILLHLYKCFGSDLDELVPIRCFASLLRSHILSCVVMLLQDSFGGLVVSMLASGTRVRGFKPGRSRWIFQASEKSSACLPSEGK
jgi:hypothetical protein